MTTKNSHGTTPAKSATSAKSTKSAAHATEVTMHSAAHHVSTAAVSAPATATATVVTNPLIASLPTEEDVATVVDALDTVSTLLGGNAAPLTRLQRQRSLRFRKGGEPIVGLLASLGIQYEVQLPGVDPKEMQANILLAQRLQPLDTKLRTVASLVSDTLQNAKSQAWQGTTSLYTALGRASSREPSLQKELEPARAFFKRATPAASAAAGTTAAKKPTKKQVKEAAIANAAAAAAAPAASGAEGTATPAAPPSAAGASAGAGATTAGAGK